jgi:hypothetical protein
MADSITYIGIKSQTAALALHRSILGIAQLSALENAAECNEFGSFRTTKAILTYYSIYHLVTACLVCSDDDVAQDIINKKAFNKKSIYRKSKED